MPTGTQTFLYETTKILPLFLPAGCYFYLRSPATQKRVLVFEDGFQPHHKADLQAVKSLLQAVSRPGAVDEPLCIMLSVAKMRKCKVNARF